MSHSVKVGEKGGRTPVHHPARPADPAAAGSAVAPWWGERSKEAYNTGFAGAAAASRNWDDSRKGRRKGPKVGFPRFKAKRRAVPSCRFTTGTIRVEGDRRHVTLPRVGTVRTHESTRRLHRRLDNGSARILSATVSYRRGRWQGDAAQPAAVAPDRRCVLRRDPPAVKETSTVLKTPPPSGR
ncbi:hypothetical protein GCM10010182_28310 [Actinomadura cremea]|nr:hypothetical protein GCM10010182_28310 [Actinomadura cremea]